MSENRNEIAGYALVKRRTGEGGEPRVVKTAKDWTEIVGDAMSERYTTSREQREEYDMYEVVAVDHDCIPIEGREPVWAADVSTSGYHLGSMQGKLLGVLTDEWQYTGEVAEKVGRTAAQVSSALASMAKSGIIENRKVEGTGWHKNRMLNQWKRAQEASE